MKRKNYVYAKEIPKVVETEDFSLEISKAILESLKKRGLLTRTQIEQCIDIVEKNFKNDKSRD